jgi:hypothetical protein
MSLPDPTQDAPASFMVMWVNTNYGTSNVMAQFDNVEDAYALCIQFNNQNNGLPDWGDRFYVMEGRFVVAL